MVAPWFRASILAALAWVCLTHAVSAQTLAFPTLSGRVVDEAGLLDPADRLALTDTLARLEAKTTDQLVVVTLKSLSGIPIEDYGYQLGRRWGIGQKDKDSGALLIVAAAERKVRIEVGYGLEGTLTDALTKGIIETSILPRFKAGDLPGGIKAGTGQIVQALGGGPGEPTGTATTMADAAHPARGQTALWPILLIVAAGVGLMIFCSVTHGGGLCRGIVQMLFLVLLSGRGGGGGGSRERSSFAGGGGSFGGGGSSGSW